MSPESGSSPENKPSFYREFDSVKLANIADKTDNYLLLCKLRTIAEERLNINPEDTESILLKAIVASRMVEMQQEEKEVARLLTLEAMSIGYWESQFKKNDLPPQ